MSSHVGVQLFMTSPSSGSSVTQLDRVESVTTESVSSVSWAGSWWRGDACWCWAKAARLSVVLLGAMADDMEVDVDVRCAWFLAWLRVFTRC